MIKEKIDLNKLKGLQLLAIEHIDCLFIGEQINHLEFRYEHFIGLRGDYADKINSCISIIFIYFDVEFQIYLNYDQIQTDLYKNKKLIESYIREDFWTPENHSKVFAKDLYLIMNKYNIPLQVPKKVSYFKFKRSTNNIFEILWTKLKYFFTLNSIEDDLNIYNKYFNLESWCIEFNHDLKIPCREIGLDKFNKPILLLPKHNEKLSNYNIYSLDFYKKTFIVLDIDEEEFESLWNTN